MTQDETSVCARFVRKLPALAFLTLASGYGCGSPAPTGLFAGSSELGNAGGAVLGSGGSGTAGGSSDGGSGLVGGGGGGGVAALGGGSSGGAGGALSAGAPNGGSSSGGVSAGGVSAGGGGGASEPSACDGKLVKPPALVADFEQGVAGWLGYMDNMAAPVTSSTPGAALTLHAATFSGGSAMISGMYFRMPCRDVSDFDGISFWGRSEGTSAVRFLAVIPKTDPNPGGDCAAPMKCSDHPGKPFSFGPEWVLYHAAWSELKQLGFGSMASFSGVINAVLWINDGPVDHFDFSIDQVSFYNGAAPTP
ncbi:MAG TPA: hypothetical protein VNW92_31065 [Polyangiaceae bacterium]|jgi:hypothetical protein|nr:hypothetical protein [Polyangiaceae bacterium]